MCGKEDIDSVFEKIQILGRDRKLLYEMAEVCRNRVKERHDRGEYVRFLMEDV